jgi:hypothetical protein
MYRGFISQNRFDSAGFGTMHVYMSVAGFHRASPSTTLDDVYAVISKLLLQLYEILVDSSIGF